jgi:DNA-directed RNA polymerase specialized sigma24 family protein
MPNLDSTSLQVDETTLTDMIQHVKAMIYSFSRSSGIDVEDLTQDVMMKYFIRWDSIQAALNPHAYARRVARNILIDKYHHAIRSRAVSMNALEEMGAQF